jgi:YD repeat-containing protein
MNRSIVPVALGASLAVLGLGNLASFSLAQATPPVWHNCLTREVWSPEKQAWCKKLQTLQNATYSLPDYGEVELENGIYSYEEAQKRYRISLVNRPGLVLFGDLNGDGKEDAVTLLSVNSGGSGQFTYLTSVLDVNGQAKALKPVMLGDRIKLNAVNLASQVITVDMVTQGPQDPLCCPTQAVKQVYHAQGNSLQLVSNIPAESIDTKVFLENDTYAVRVFQQQGRPVMNLYYKEKQIVLLSAVSVQAETTPEATRYTYTGDGMTVRVTNANNGKQLLEINGEVQVEAMSTQQETVSGTVSYRQRIALPPNTQIVVQLLDVSRQDAPAEVLATETITLGDRQVPVPFTLAYNPDRIIANNTYAVNARILVDGNLQFISTTRYAVITQGAPNQVDVVVDSVAARTSQTTPTSVESEQTSQALTCSGIIQSTVNLTAYYTPGEGFSRVEFRPQTSDRVLTSQLRSDGKDPMGHGFWRGSVNAMADVSLVHLSPSTIVKPGDRIRVTYDGRSGEATCQ